MRNSPLFVLGIILIVAGAAALIWQGISYTQHETVVAVGPVNVTAETQKTIPLPPILGALSFAGGILLVALGAKKT